jgi:hypothetical protein
MLKKAYHNFLNFLFDDEIKEDANVNKKELQFENELCKCHTVCNKLCKCRCHIRVRLFC